MSLNRVFTKAEIKEMCRQSYMRGMSIQHGTITKKKTVPKVFNNWVEELIETCPLNKFK